MRWRSRLSAGGASCVQHTCHMPRIIRPGRSGSSFPSAPAGPADVTARLIGNVLQESFGQPFVVENRTGAGGVIGTLEAAKSPPDGYTLLMMSNTQTANELLVPQRKYELMRDLAPIAPVNYSDLVIVVHPSVPAKTLQEFIALAKSQPGKLNYASSGQGTPYHMAGELFKTMAGIDVVHVPYRNSGEARSGVIGGQVQMMIDAVPAMAPNIGENQVRALATTGKTRSSVLPDVPTVIEAGVPGYEATIWLGLMAPAGTPKPIIDKLNAAVNAAVKRPDIVKLWTEQGAVPMSMTPEEFDKFLRGDIVKWAEVVKKFDKSVNQGHSVRHAAHSISPQWRRDRGRRRSRSLAARHPARTARPDRSAFRLRRRRMRRLPCHRRRSRGGLLRHAAVVGRGQGRHHDRGLGQRRAAASAAARLHRRAGDAMRLLRFRHPDERGGAVDAKSRRPTEAEVSAALDRNLCRCGSHNRMVRAVLRAACARWRRNDRALSARNCRSASRPTQDCRPG